MDWTVAVADGIALLKLCFVRRLTGEKHCSEAAMLRFKSVIEPVGNYGVSEVERRSETRSLYVCALCLLESLLDTRGARPTGV
jgi:hypothetical protein